MLLQPAILALLPRQPITIQSFIPGHPRPLNVDSPGEQAAGTQQPVMLEWRMHVQPAAWCRGVLCCVVTYEVQPRPRPGVACCWHSACPAWAAWGQRCAVGRGDMTWYDMDEAQRGRRAARIAVLGSFTRQAGRRASGQAPKGTGPAGCAATDGYKSVLCCLVEMRWRLPFCWLPRCHIIWIKHI